MQAVDAEQARSTPIPERTQLRPNHWMLLHSWSCSRAQSFRDTHATLAYTGSMWHNNRFISIILFFWSREAAIEILEKKWLPSSTFKPHWDSTNVFLILTADRLDD